MAIYLLKRRDERPRYDATNGFVIVALDAGEARNIASQHATDEGKDVWLDTERTTCTEIAADSDSRVILSSFNAG